MTKDEIETVRAIVRMECDAAFKQHLSAMVSGCIAPLAEAIAQVQENQNEITRGQLLVEKMLVSQLPPDDEDWRESLGED
jgi:hypothetical protein